MIKYIGLVQTDGIYYLSRGRRRRENPASWKRSLQGNGHLCHVCATSEFVVSHSRLIVCPIGVIPVPDLKIQQRLVLVLQHNHSWSSISGIRELLKHLELIYHYWLIFFIIFIIGPMQQQHLGKARMHWMLLCWHITASHCFANK